MPLFQLQVSLEENMNYAIRQIERMAEILGIDIEWFAQKKMEYNETRPYRHGGKVY